MYRDTKNPIPVSALWNLAGILPLFLNPAATERQRRFFGAELARARRGLRTRTGLGEEELRKWARKRNPSEESEYHNGDHVPYSAWRWWDGDMKLWASITGLVLDSPSLEEDREWAKLRGLPPPKYPRKNPHSEAFEERVLFPLFAGVLALVVLKVFTRV